MIIFLVEEYSMEKFLEAILPRLGFKEGSFNIKSHHGKGDLMENLPKIVPILCKNAQQIIVIVDQDRQDCILLKKEIKEKMAWCLCEHTIRIACYELEAWFLGDMPAISKCSPRFKADFFQKQGKIPKC